MTKTLDIQSSMLDMKNVSPTIFCCFAWARKSLVKPHRISQEITRNVIGQQLFETLCQVQVGTDDRAGVV